ncbi:MAG: DNA polymerase ligase N-terminal domain-containing protein [Gemmatimonadaceae bacterium]
MKEKANPATASKSAAKSATTAKDILTPDAQLTEYRRKRDFAKTAEPAGEPNEVPKKAPAKRATRTGELRFVIQKHAASHLHYDLRLEIDGVMKSWAVPKGPSADPKVKRLAMQVEDHPVEYNSFEGTIPAGEYGGGTVMLWDTGTYSIEDAGDRAQNSAAHDEYETGELKLDFHGKRIQGSYALVRTKGNMRGSSSSKPSWLLLKHRDDDARSAEDPELTAEFTTSVVSDRSMNEISDAG